MSFSDNNNHKLNNHKLIDKDKFPVVPKHIAVIMDGNGRWAQARQKKRVQGHKVGMERAREIVQICGELGVSVITLFAFSSENWKRPKEEVSFLLDLFITGLNRETKTLHKNNVKLKVIGDLSKFDKKLQKVIAESELKTQDNDGILLQVAANYGGQWDILQSVNQCIAQKLTQTSIPDTTEKNTRFEVSKEDVEAHLSTFSVPEPDLLIRTGGEKRISNFLLWQAAYSELYFSDLLWPDFDKHALYAAIDDFCSRQRRFGMTGEQIS